MIVKFEEVEDERQKEAKLIRYIVNTQVRRHVGNTDGLINL